MAMVDAALEYARRGEPVLPLRENAKEPATDNGFYDASINDAEIEKLFVKPYVNIGVRVGQESNIIVIDIDNKSGKDGRARLTEIEARLGTLPLTRTVETRHGKHFYFNFPNKWRYELTKSEYAPGLDIKAKGYVVAPPSTIEGFTYYVKNDVPTAELPDAWVTEAIKVTPDRHDWNKLRPKDSGLSICEEYGISMNDVLTLPANARKTYDWYLIKHPIHGATGSGNMSINASRDLWYCFRCGTGGDALTYLAVREGFIDCADAGPLDRDTIKKCLEVLRKEGKVPDDRPTLTEPNGPGEQALQDKARERALEILETGDPRSFILETFKTQHIGDNETAEGILIGTANQSIANSKGIQSAVFGESGRGKSHAARAMLHLFPKQYSIIASLSDKALFYLEGDELHAGMTIFSDDAKLSEGIEGIIKRSTAFFQEETVHKVATKEGGKWTAKNLKIPERINWLLTSVDSQGSEQLVNRQIGFGVDETPEQDERVMAFELEKALNGLPEFEVTEDVLTCREILLNIKEDETGAQRLFTVKIPFANRIEWLDKANRRNLPIFLDMVRGYAVLNFKKRVMAGGAIIATEEDFKAAERLYNTRGGFQKLHIHEREKEMIQHIAANGGELLTEELMHKLKLSGVRVRQIAERLETVLPNFYVELRSESVRDGSDDSKSTTTRRNYFCYNGAVTIDLFGSVVSLREPTPDEWEEESTLTTLTPLKEHFNPSPIKVVSKNEKPVYSQIMANKEFNNNINKNNNNNDNNKTPL